MNKEKILELIDLLAQSSWTLAEIKASELGLTYQDLASPIQELQQQPDRILELERKLSDERFVGNNRKEQLAQSQTKVAELESELATERETTQQALQTSQEWHERQKGEIIAEWSNKYQNLVNKWKSSLQQEITLLKEILNHD